MSFAPAIVSVVDLVPTAAFSDSRLSYEDIGVLSSLVYIDASVGEIDVSADEFSQMANKADGEIELIFSKLEQCGYVCRESGRVVAVIYDPKKAA